MQKILVIDNYDSFVYNLVHYLEELNCDVTIKRNDAVVIEEVSAFDKLLFSPGPGIPDDAGLLKDIIKAYAGKKDMLGVCLGHQAICEVFGGSITNLESVFHGIASTISLTVKDEKLFKGLKYPIEVGRYHSWTTSTPLPETLETTSIDEFGNIMSFRHKVFNIKGIQFHPESVLTPQGKQIIKNWITN